MIAQPLQRTRNLKKSSHIGFFVRSTIPDYEIVISLCFDRELHSFVSDRGSDLYRMGMFSFLAIEKACDAAVLSVCYTFFVSRPLYILVIHGEWIERGYLSVSTLAIRLCDDDTIAYLQGIYYPFLLREEHIYHIVRVTQFYEEKGMITSFCIDNRESQEGSRNP